LSAKPPRCECGPALIIGVIILKTARGGDVKLAPRLFGALRRPDFELFEQLCEAPESIGGAMRSEFSSEAPFRQEHRLILNRIAHVLTARWRRPVYVGEGGTLNSSYDVTGHTVFLRPSHSSSREICRIAPRFRVHRDVKGRDRILTRVGTGGIPELGNASSELLTYPHRNLSGSISGDSPRLRIACEDPSLGNGSPLC
jgi:hypothetical protein